ncbi:hypothetical protein GGX14DRAFT_405126 [Mycena pura]|uniref:Uncharacterized protein n=1 Tax=Mycena pura TaxID=153505 RepID=A0AAD6UWD0_9AGAR|nr:hypothetical protein GGX14DRAFT_405126 [Mycena pura]
MSSAQRRVELIGYLFYSTELQRLKHLLTHLPSTIAAGQDHDFIGNEPDQELVKDLGCEKSVINRALEEFQGFGSHQTVQEGTRKAWGTRNLASGLKKNIF